MKLFQARLPIRLLLSTQESSGLSAAACLPAWFSLGWLWEPGVAGRVPQQQGTTPATSWVLVQLQKPAPWGDVSEACLAVPWTPHN